jgi:hypothetical protein
MSKFNIVFMTLIFCSAAFAEPVLYVCERPAWEGKEGCGPNNIYYTYNLFVDTDDFHKDKPEYDFQMSKSCDASKAQMWTYTYKVSEETIVFWFNQVPAGRVHSQLLSTIKLDRESLKAVLSKVEHSAELTCRKEKGENRRPGTSPARRGY